MPAHERNHSARQPPAVDRGIALKEERRGVKLLRFLCCETPAVPAPSAYNRRVQQENPLMTFLRTACLLAILTVAVGTLAQASGGTPPAAAPQTQPSPHAAPTIASVTDRQVSQYEKLLVEAAEAMPADKFDF